LVRHQSSPWKAGKKTGLANYLTNDAKEEKYFENDENKAVTNTKKERSNSTR